jgi:hypothetical protein
MKISKVLQGALLAGALVTAAACGGGANANCPPADGTPIGSTAVEQCGCFVDAAARSSFDQLRSSVDDAMRSNGQACTFRASGPSTELAGVRISSVSRAARAASDPETGNAAGGLVRYHFAIAP